MNKIKLLALAAVAVTTLSMSGQARKGVLHINEVMTQNDSSFVDDFGGRPAWIELYNSKFAPLEISSVYLTTDSARSNVDNWYSVPLHDVKTKIEKRQHVVFWADGMASRGTFHTNFTLDPTKENDIYLFDSDKVTLLDHVKVPVLAPNTSYARCKDGVTVTNEDGSVNVAKTWEVRDDIAEGKYITPSSNNVIEDRNDKVEKFATMDGQGFAMSAMAMAIVFAALAVLCICFMIISKVGSLASRVNKMRSQGGDVKEATLEDLPEHDSGEEIAAIIMALHEHLNAHDNESTVLTIDKVRRAYSPWSSKIYNMRHIPNR